MKFKFLCYLVGIFANSQQLYIQFTRVSRFLLLFPLVLDDVTKLLKSLNSGSEKKIRKSIASIRAISINIFFLRSSPSHWLRTWLCYQNLCTLSVFVSLITSIKLFFTFTTTTWDDEMFLFVGGREKSFAIKIRAIKWVAKPSVH